MGGVKCPQPARQVPGHPRRAGEEYAEEALQYSREMLMQRGVTLRVDTCDRGGNFIGILWYGKK